MKPIRRTSRGPGAPIRRLLAAIFTVALTFPVAGAAALAGPVPGSDDADFRAARDAWLQDYEAQALPALAQLATDGNDAARLLLGRIDSMPTLQGPYLAHMPATERAALMRAPGGMSGLNWVPLAGDHPVVTAMTALRRPYAAADGGIGAAETLAREGEPLAARTAAMVLAGRGHAGLRHLTPETLESPLVDSEMLFLVWRHADRQARERVAALVAEGHPQRALMGLSTDPERTALWLRESETAAPVAALCAVACPEDNSACLGAAYRAVGGHELLLRIASPSETLISQEEFLASPRGRGSVLRRMMLAHTLRARGEMLARMHERVPCLAAALEDEIERYRRRLPSLDNQP
ncbi:hypothetical protein JI664_06465 [Rhodobacter sp. NTK016B]|uniref:hypothetical protein n=1 Tax=Rhodobacter sp. NTK016B TaxID=2759676 RepID=UPI001A8F8045|nr:hypothetical protein [Rhodobacter sp. NTK016B]MBN8291599.1 hypothetical protein [Rhodobacter sp. NTK016B]